MGRASVNRSVVFALVAAALLGLWLLSGQLPGSNGADSARKQPSAAEASLVSVRVRTLDASPRKSDLIIRGRTEAQRKVAIRAEVEGIVEALPVEKGKGVSEGDVICRLSIDSRQARLDEASAVLKQRSLEHDAAEQLAARGFRSQTQVAAARAALDAARAQLKAIEIEIGDTNIRAPYDGILDERAVEIGDFMRKGDICGVVVDQDPFLVVGQVSEREVGLLSPGDRGSAKLVTGMEVTGHIRFIAKQADAATRTFRVELEVPNPEELLRDGITAEIRVPVREVQAHRLSPAVLALDDRGTVGVRIVENGDTVRFRSVSIIAEGNDGLWVTGLPDRVTVITVGQEFVADGQKVKPVPEKAAP